MTHDDLVERAAKWLRSGVKVTCRRELVEPHKFARKIRCDVVMNHKTIVIGEEPDAFGWSASTSILVECKCSRSDFRADFKKLFRKNPKMGVGQYRYYLTPKGLLRIDEIPQDWGLAEVCGKVVRVKKLAYQQEFNQNRERHLLLHLIRREHPPVSSGQSQSGGA